MILNVRTYSTLDDGLELAVDWRQDGGQDGEPGPWQHDRALLRPQDLDVADAAHVALMISKYLARWASDRGV